MCTHLELQQNATCYLSILPAQMLQKGKKTVYGNSSMMKSCNYFTSLCLARKRRLCKELRCDLERSGPYVQRRDEPVERWIQCRRWKGASKQMQALLQSDCRGEKGLDCAVITEDILYRKETLKDRTNGMNIQAHLSIHPSIYTFRHASFHPSTDLRRQHELVSVWDQHSSTHDSMSQSLRIINHFH